MNFKDLENAEVGEFPITYEQKMRIEALLQIANIPDKTHEDISKKYKALSTERAERCIQYLEKNKMADHIRMNGGQMKKSEVIKSVIDAVENPNT